jgi:hypothetical protein
VELQLQEIADLLCKKLVEERRELVAEDPEGEPTFPSP